MPDYTILLIDYEPRSIAKIRQPLEQAGYRVEVATDGIAGAKRFVELKPDLTLIEAMLPKRHGFEVCRELKNTPHGKQAPVAIITGVYRGRKYRSEAMHHYHCDAYLEKPIAAEDLLAAIEKLVGRPSRSAKAAAPAPKVPEAPANAPAPPARSAPKAPMLDASEAEISDHLDSLLMGGGGNENDGTTGNDGSAVLGGSKKSSDTVASVTPPNLIDFDPERRADRDGDTVQSSAADMSLGVAHGAAAQLAVAPETRVAGEEGAPGARDDLGASGAEVVDRPPSTGRGRLVAWLAFILLVLLGAIMLVSLL